MASLKTAVAVAGVAAGVLAGIQGSSSPEKRPTWWQSASRWLAGDDSSSLPESNQSQDIKSSTESKTEPTIVPSTSQTTSTTFTSENSSSSFGGYPSLGRPHLSLEEELERQREVSQVI